MFYIAESCFDPSVFAIVVVVVEVDLTPIGVITLFLNWPAEDMMNTTVSCGFMLRLIPMSFQMGEIFLRIIPRFVIIRLLKNKGFERFHSYFS